MERHHAALIALVLTAGASTAVSPANDPLPVVPGVNADYLDGLDAGAFAPVDHRHPDLLGRNEAVLTFARVDHGHPGLLPRDEATATFARVGHGHPDLLPRSEAEERFAPTGHVHAELLSRAEAGATYYSRVEADARFTRLDASPRVPETFDLEGVRYRVTGEATWPGNGHIYAEILADRGINWLHARDAARFMGGHLVTLTSAAENEFVLDSIFTSSRLAIGLTDARSEGAFEWITGEVAPDGQDSVYTNWDAPHEPNDQFGREDAVELHSFPEGEWNDVPMDFAGLHGFILEISQSQAGG